MYIPWYATYRGRQGGWLGLAPLHSAEGPPPRLKVLALVVGGRAGLEGGHELTGGERGELIVVDVSNNGEL